MVEIELWNILKKDVNKVNKPKPINSKPYYDLISVLNFIDKKVPGYKKEIWKELCDMGYIKNDTITDIYFDGLIGNDSANKLIEGIECMFKEFPDIKNGEVNFSISW